MAPPSKRRPGFSRKAQYQIFTGYLLAFFTVLAGLALVVIAAADPRGFAVLRSGANEVTAPVGHGFASLRVGVHNIGKSVSAYFFAASQNAELQEEAKKNRIALIEARALKQENKRLKRLLGLVEQDGKTVVAARLIGSTSASTRRIAILGAGSRQGVRAGQPVRASNGLIGRVLDTSLNTSRVLLITDPDNVVPVRRARDGLVAFAEGRSDGLIDIRLINIGVNPFKPGDVMLTSGSGGLYAPNIPVAIIERKTTDGAVARILADPAATDFVVVQSIYQPEIATRIEAEDAENANLDNESEAEAAKRAKAETPQ